MIPTEENVKILKKVTNMLNKAINQVGISVTAKPLEGNVLIKHIIIDLSKKIHANLWAFENLIDDFHLHDYRIKKIPLSLCLRGALSDSLTGIYLYSLRDDLKSLENETKVLSRDHANFLKDSETLILEYRDELEGEEFDQSISKWISEFKSSSPSFFKEVNNSEWNYKSAAELRQTSKYKPEGRCTEKDKFEWLKKVDTEKRFIPIYFILRYFSQYQHYSYSNREMIDNTPDDDFRMFFGAIVYIREVFWAFADGLESTYLIKDSYSTMSFEIDKLISAT